MDRLKPPRPKKAKNLKKGLPLPLFPGNKGENYKFTGNFNGFCVTVRTDIEKLYYNGFFGKSNLSRGFPSFPKAGKTKIIRKRQYEARSEWKKQVERAVVEENDRKESDETKEVYMKTKHDKVRDKSDKIRDQSDKIRDQSDKIRHHSEEIRDQSDKDKEQDLTKEHDKIMDKAKDYTNLTNFKLKQSKAILLPDSDSEEELQDYLTNLTAVYCADYNLIEEKLCLSLEDAFFLSQSLNCLNIFENDRLLEGIELWNVFCETDCNFIQNYAVYHYYRSKNWVVKPGIKFGGDYRK